MNSKPIEHSDIFSQNHQSKKAQKINDILKPKIINQIEDLSILPIKIPIKEEIIIDKIENINAEDINSKIIIELNNKPELIKESIYVKDYYSKGGSATCFICESEKFPGKQFIMKNIENSSSLTKNLSFNHFQKIIQNEFFIHYISKCRYVTTVNGLFQIDNKFLIFSEFEKYGDLSHFNKKYLNMTNLTESMTIYFSGMIIKGLEHLHRLKICHFDIKLENIVINGFFNAKITDFSISRDYSHLKEVKLYSTGTPQYISPEQYQNKIIASSLLERVDLWSFGIVLYKLVYGYFPFNLGMRHFKKELNQPQERPSSSAILNQILNNKLRFCKKAVDISPGLKNLINGL